MNKKAITAVMVLMGISLLGIIAYQLYWIHQAYLVKEEQFDRGVQEALNQVATKLETQEAVDVIRNQMQHYHPAPPPEAPPAPQPEALAAMPVAQSRQALQAPAKTRLAPTSQGRRKARITITADTLLLTRPQGQTAQRSRPGTWVSGEKAKSQRFTALRNLDSASLQQLIYLTTSLDSGRFHNQVNKTFFRMSTDSSGQVLLQVDTLRSRRLPLLSAGDLVPGSHIIKIDSTTTIQVHQGTRYAQLATGASKRGPATPPQARGGGPYSGSAPPLYYLASPAPRVMEASVLRPALIPRAQGQRQPSPIHPTYQKKIVSQVQEQTDEIPEVRQVSQEKIVRQVAGKTDKLTDVIQQMAVEYVRKSLPLEKRLSRQQLDTLLRQELANQGVALAFDFAVLREGKTAYQPLQTAGFGPAPAQDQHQVKLFPNDIEAQANFLALHFPGKNHYILYSLKVMMGFSLLFTLIILSTFLVSIYTILKQKKISEVKNDFINNMTHEFKTPLATISLAIDSINNAKVLDNQDRIRHYTAIIREENKRMNKQVENVLQMALLDKQELKLNRQLVDMHALICQAVQNMQLLLEAKGGTIAIQKQASQWQVSGDEAHLGHVISNLLDNAIKYSPQAPEITLTTTNNRAELVIAVEDKGLGMSKDTQRKIFEKFYRVSTGNIHNIKGFGLGLSYVKAIMVAHKGSVSVKSEPGHGSRFELTLPVIN